MAKSYLQQAIDFYGLTSDPRSAGYILPDGSLLDFSEGQPGQRSQDHRNLSFIVRGPGEKQEAALLRELDEIQKVPEYWKDEGLYRRRNELRQKLRRAQDWTRTDAMYRFMEVTGAIRMLPEQNGYDIVTRPTEAQIRSMADATLLLNRSPIIDMKRKGKEQFLREYEPWEASQAWRDVRAYWR